MRAKRGMVGIVEVAEQPCPALPTGDRFTD
jgi:hypothetical protein